MSAQTIPVFAISLARGRDRRIAIQRHLRGLGAQFECVEALDGKLLSPQELEKVSEAPDLPLGQIACCMSHFSVYERIVTRGIPVACVLEDDGRLRRSAVRLLEHGCARPPAFDLCLLDSADGNHKGVVCFDRDSAQELAPRMFAYELSDAPGLSARIPHFLRGCREATGWLTRFRYENP